MNTAMQELIQLLNKRQIEKGYWMGEEIEMAQKLLEKEKQQIIEAGTCCYLRSASSDDRDYNEMTAGEYYYNETYKQ